MFIYRYSKQEYEFVGCEYERAVGGGREVGSDRRNALWRQPGPGVAGDRGRRVPPSNHCDGCIDPVIKE